MLQGSDLPVQDAPRSRVRRLGRAAAWALGAALLAYGLAQAVARHACADGRLRARIAATLGAHLGPVELGPDVRVDWLFRVRFGPLTVPGPRRGDAPLLRVNSIRVRPDLVRLLRSGRAAPASVRLDGVRVELPDGPDVFTELSRRLDHRHAGGAAAAADGGVLPPVHVRDLRIAFTVRGHRLTAGPLHVVVRPGSADRGAPLISVAASLPGGGRGTADVRREGEGWHATARLEHVDPRALPPELQLRTATWAAGTLAARVDGVYVPARREARLRLDATGRGLAVGGAVIGAEPLGPLDLGFAGELAWSGPARQLRLSRGRVMLPGGAPLAVEGELGLQQGLPLALRARAEQVDFLATAAALPPALALPDQAPHPTGTFDAHLTVTGPLADPGAWELDAGIDLSRMRAEARQAGAAALQRPFLHRAEPDHGPAREFVVGPANAGFVPVAELPRYVVRAVTTSEDAGFFGHAGFDFEELRLAAVQGAQAGKVVRGGSTISQQLAKNLYLTREKTLARKAREALVTVALEATVPKQRLLEIYLNVAEWGPGVWGIGPAARHWFGKDARELTPKEAAFLATVIPNPVRYHYMWSRGWLSEHWEERVEGLLRTMATQGALSEEELADALAQPLTFASCARAEGPAAAGVTCRGT